MDPVIYIVILAAAVLFLSNIFRGDKEAQNSKRTGPANRARPPEGDVDRFLEEINRRRREANERRAAKSDLPAQPPPPLRRPEPRRPEPPRRSLPSESRPARVPQAPVPKVQTPSVLKKAPPVVLPVSPVVAAPVVVAEVKPPPLSPAPAAAKVTSRAPSPAVARLLPLLHSRQTLRAAILLQEILGPPLAHRRKRRIG